MHRWCMSRSPIHAPCLPRHRRGVRRDAGASRQPQGRRDRPGRSGRTSLRAPPLLAGLPEASCDRGPQGAVRHPRSAICVPLCALGPAFARSAVSRFGRSPGFDRYRPFLGDGHSSPPGSRIAQFCDPPSRRRSLATPGIGAPISRRRPATGRVSHSLRKRGLYLGIGSIGVVKNRVRSSPTTEVAASVVGRRAVPVGIDP